MNKHWLLLTSGNPLGTVKKFLRNLFKEASLDGLFIPTLIEESGGMQVAPRLLRQPAELSATAPFVPFMPVNAAALIPDLARQHPGERIGVVLRACEVRALAEILRREPVATDDLLIIGMDCLGTFQIEEDGWWENIERVTNKVLQFARQGGVAPYRYRAACQMCTSPMAAEADLSIGVLGLPVQQFVLITARDEETARKLRLARLTDGEASAELLAQRDQMRATLDERRAHARSRITGALQGDLALTVDELIAHLTDCPTCRESLQNCPICTRGEKLFAEDGTISRDAVIHWLSACAGCGMCEQSSPDHLPLAAIFTRLHEQLDAMLAEGAQVV